MEGSVSGRMEDLLVSTDKSAVGSHLMLCMLLLWLQDAGDFAAVAYFVLLNRCPERGK